jgi:hypothetical protein
MGAVSRQPASNAATTHSSFRPAGSRLHDGQDVIRRAAARYLMKRRVPREEES